MLRRGLIVSIIIFAALVVVLNFSFVSSALGGAGKIRLLSIALVLSFVEVGFVVGIAWRFFVFARQTANEPAVLHEPQQKNQKENIEPFSTTLAHHMRVPLSQIGMVFKSLLAQNAGTLNEKQIELVKRGHATTQHIGTMLSSILDSVRIEENKFVYDEGNVDLGVLLKQICEELSLVSDFQKVTVMTDFSSGLSHRIEADPRKLSRAFEHIIENAIRYSHEGGTVRVLLKRKNDMHEIVVSDSGVGIPEPEQPKLSSKFFRASNVPSEVPGAGLGLFLARHIIEHYGGAIHIVSKEGRGTTVTVTLPVHFGV